MIKFNVPYVSNNEEKHIRDVISNKKFSGNGKYSKLCEDFLENKYSFNKCYLTPSCTAAIEITALLLDLNPGDEIIIPSYTFASCPNPFLIGGAKIIFADTEKDYPNVSVNHIESLITQNTKAIMIMHYGGVTCNLEKIQAICKQNNLFLIEDAAQCINAFHNKKPLGTFGDVSVFSFHETKNVNCGEGGMIVINNPDLLEKVEIIRQYGTNRTDFIKNGLSHYESVGLGLALFQSEINAAFLYAQLQDIDDISEKRKILWNYYNNSLKKIASESTFKLPQVNPNFNNHIFFITVRNRKDTDTLIQFLVKNNISAVKHFYPLHQSKFHASNNNKGDFPNATEFNETLIRLPLHHYLTVKKIDFIVEKIDAFFTQQ
ncbi:MAG: dTDP-4-amino-4,6-dideoxygalactose transaminase [Flavobacteriales bacterium]|nr:dTDP-4-amino-4,6-dideoxygalactose transaminase [Flavobacteriales bacterium]